MSFSWSVFFLYINEMTLSTKNSPVATIQMFLISIQAGAPFWVSAMFVEWHHRHMVSAILINFPSRLQEVVHPACLLSTFVHFVGFPPLLPRMQKVVVQQQEDHTQNGGANNYPTDHEEKRVCPHLRHQQRQK